MSSPPRMWSWGSVSGRPAACGAVAPQLGTSAALGLGGLSSLNEPWLAESVLEAKPTIAGCAAPYTLFIDGVACYFPDDVVTDLVVEATNRIANGDATGVVYAAEAAAWWTLQGAWACRGGRMGTASPFTNHVSPVRSGGTVVALP